MILVSVFSASSFGKGAKKEIGWLGSGYSIELRAARVQLGWSAFNEVRRSGSWVSGLSFRFSNEGKVVRVLGDEGYFAGE